MRVTLIGGFLVVACGSTQSTQTHEATDTQPQLSPIVTTIEGEPIPLSRVEQLADELVDPARHAEVCERLTEIYESAAADDSQHLAAFADAVVPELVALLDWSEDTIEAAVHVARLLDRMHVPERHVPRVVDGLATAFRRIEGNRGVDNRLRIETVRALGNTQSQRAVGPLVEIASSRDSQRQNFLINRLAIEELSPIADPRAIEFLLRALFLFDPENPMLRMNDVAAVALIHVGDAAHEPLLALLDGDDEAINALVDEYIEAVRQRDAAAADQMSRAELIQNEAAFALGAIGDPRALDALIDATNEGAPSVRVTAATALVRLNLDEAQQVRARNTLRNVYAASTEPVMRTQLAAAMRYLYDRELLPYLFVEVQHDRERIDVRLVLARTYAMLANGEDARMLASVIERVEEDDRPYFSDLAEPLAAAEECDEDVTCWLRMLDDEGSAEKAATMLGLLGRDDSRVIAALIERLDDREIAVRHAALLALDHVATQGSPEAVRAIDELRDREMGRSIWHHFEREAMPVRARLHLRATGH